MSRLNALVVFLVVIVSHQLAAYGDELTSGQDETSTVETIPNSGLSSDGKFAAFLLPNLFNSVQAASRGFDNNRNEDHYNVDVDKLNEASRYELLPSAMPTTNKGVSYSLFSRVLGDELARNQNERKRNIRRQLNAPKEDKDYSFVSVLPVRHATPAPYRAGGSMAQKLHDLLLESEQAYRLANKYRSSNQNLDQLPQVYLRSFGDLRNANDILPKNREKRRRCKVDPNSGVKNPSMCDTDAYFGAADYGMREIWDSAGR